MWFNDSANLSILYFHQVVISEKLITVFSHWNRIVAFDCEKSIDIDKGDVINFHIRDYLFTYI